MFLPVHNAVGSLTADIGAADVVINATPAFVAALVAAGIDGTNHTYVRAYNQYGVEVLKVLNVVSGSIQVERGTDGSTAMAFPSGTYIEYILCATAVQELIDESIAALGPEQTLTFAINAPHTVQRVDDNVTIGIVYQDVVSSDGTIDVSVNVDDAIDLSVRRGAFGCCDN